ncbi:Dynein ATPase, partial [Bertholletia excelsa]
TREWKEKKMLQSSSSHRQPWTNAGDRSSTEQAKLAAVAIELNVRLRSADMPADMQERALRSARSLLDSSPVGHRPNPSLLARSLKKEFDSEYGPAWHCVAGKSFGSFVTYSPGGFVYFSVDSLSVLLFKTHVHLVPEPGLDPHRLTGCTEEKEKTRNGDEHPSAYNLKHQKLPMDTKIG